MPGGNLRQRQGIAHRGRGVLAALHLIARLQTDGGQNITLLAVGIMQQGNASCAVWIVLDRVDLGRYSILIATEVDDAVISLVSAATEASGGLALVVAAARATLGAQQALFRLRPRRQLEEIAHGRPAASGRCRIVTSNAHGNLVYGRGRQRALMYAMVGGNPPFPISRKS